MNRKYLICVVLALCVLLIGAVGDWYFPANVYLVNGAALSFADTSTNLADFVLQNDNNFVFYGTNASGVGRAVWNIIQHSSTSHFQFDVPVDLVNQSLNLNSGQVICWNGDAGISRDAAITLDFGTCTSGDKSGALLAGIYKTWGGTSVSSSLGTSFLRANSSFVYSWTSGSDATVAPDTGLSRDSAGVIDFGNGTAGNTSASLKIGANLTTTSSNSSLTVSDGTSSGQFAIVSTLGAYSNFSAVGDTVLRSNGGTGNGNLILTVRSSSGAIVFGTGASDTAKWNIGSGGNFTGGSSLVFGWSSTSCCAAADTAITRDAAHTFDFGNGTFNDTSGILRATSFNFIANSVTSATMGGDSNGSIELGPINKTGTGNTPFIDFHFHDNSTTFDGQDYNVRLINGGNNQLNFNSACVSTPCGPILNFVGTQGALQFNGDSGISRISAAVIGAGNGSTGDLSGTFEATNFKLNGSTGGIIGTSNIPVRLSTGTFFDVVEGTTAGDGLRVFSNAYSSASFTASSNGVTIASGLPLSWNGDVSVSRDSAGVIDIGTGASGSTAGTLQATKYNAVSTGGFTFIGSTTTGLFLNGGDGSLQIHVSGSNYWSMFAHEFRNASNGVFGWSSATDPATAAIDTGITRDSANVFDFGNGTAGDKSATINVGACNGCGSKLLKVTGPSSTLTMNGTSQTVYTYTLPAKTLTTGCLRIEALLQHLTGTNNITWTLNWGSFALTLDITASTSVFDTSPNDICFNGATNSQLIIGWAPAWLGATPQAAASTATSAIDTTVNQTITITANSSAPDTVKGLALQIELHQ